MEEKPLKKKFQLQNSKLKKFKECEESFNCKNVNKEFLRFRENSREKQS